MKHPNFIRSIFCENSMTDLKPMQTVRFPIKAVPVNSSMKTGPISPSECFSLLNCWIHVHVCTLVWTSSTLPSKVCKMSENVNKGVLDVHTNVSTFTYI